MVTPVGGGSPYQPSQPESNQPSGQQVQQTINNLQSQTQEAFENHSISGGEYNKYLQEIETININWQLGTINNSQAEKELNKVSSQLQNAIQKGGG